DPRISQDMKNYFPNHSDLEYARNRFVDIFMNLQKSWTEQRWELARPYETDSLFQSHNYWIKDYQKKGEKNYLEKINVTKIVPVFLYNDKFYTSLTVRIYAEMIDYTLNKTGKVILGSKSKKVSFSEYWTFIKGTGSNQKPAKSHDINLCPSCGAGLKISMTGICEFCGSKITLAQFDWVLSQIEQDEEFNL
ncbi:MAG: Tim44 domain-containing protein, partial [Bdellovibrionales bacterium]|nr:Tim44 domain-containing protein [Bdellovibrionales bacterium]